MKREKQKGFTLVEVLVAVVVMAIITILAFPSIKQFQASNAKKKYETYRMTAETAAKLYVDAYADDMFGYNYTGCYDIPFEDLESSNLLKEYADNSITCMGYEGKKSYVYVQKDGDKYTYAVRMVCVKKSDNPNATSSIVYETSASEVRTCTEETGNIEVKFEGITKNKWVKNANAKVKLVSDNGLLENTRLTYCLKTDLNGDCVTTQSAKNFTNTRGEKEVGFDVGIEGMSGKYYLIVGTNYVRDVYGNFLSSDAVSDVIQVDNEAPINLTINNPYENKQTVNAYSITVGATDKHSGIGSYQYKMSTQSTWKTLSSNKTSDKINLTNENGVLQVRACDKVGNCTADKTTNVKIINTFTITLDSAGASSAGTKSVYINPTSSVYLDSEFTKAMTTSANNITIPLRAGYTFEGYYTAKNGSGNQLINRNGYITSKFTKSTFTKNSTIYAYWKACGIGTYNNGSSNFCTNCPTCKTTLSVGATSDSSCTWNYGDGSRNTVVSGYKNHLRVNCYTGEYIGDTQQESSFNGDYASYINWGNYMMEDYSSTRYSGMGLFKKGGCEPDILPNYGFKRYWMSQARLGNEINTIPTGRWQNYCGPGLIFNCNTTCDYGPLAYKTTSQYGLIYAGNRAYNFSSPALGEKTVFLHLRGLGGTRGYYISGLKFKVLNSSGGQIGYFTLKEMVDNNYIKKLVLMDSQGAANGLNIYSGGNMNTSSWTGFVTIFMINPNYGVGGFQVYSNMNFATYGCDIGSGNCKDGWYYRYTDTDNWRMTTY